MGDYEEDGLIGRLDQFSKLLKAKDEEVWRNLEMKNVQPAFYAVRWLTINLAREFEMHEVLRLWDSLLGDLASPHPLIYYLCIAKVTLVREAHLAGDFAECMRALQHSPQLSADQVLHAAMQLRATDLAPKGFSEKSIRRSRPAIRQPAFPFPLARPLK